MPGRLYCRCYQAVIKAASYLIGYHMPDYIMGAGCIEKLPESIRREGATNVLVVTGKVLLSLGVPDKLLNGLKREGIAYTVFSDISKEPTDENVEAGYQVYREHGCQALVALGGGAPMDCAKAIGAKSARPNRSVAQLMGLLKVRKRIPPLFVAPTTAGTGSEATLAAVITNAKTHRKTFMNDPALMPGFVALDPELTLSLPPAATASTGMDALCHAVEAYTNHTYNTKVENRLAKEAVALIYGNLYTAYTNGGDIIARQNLQKASFFAGRAFARGCVGYVHAIAHTLGGQYGTAHGLAIGLLLPRVLRRYGSAAHKRLAELNDACGLGGSTNQEKAERFIRWIEEIKHDMHIPDHADMIRVEDIPKLAALAAEEANPLYPVPVIWQQADFEELIAAMRSPEPSASEMASKS